MLPRNGPASEMRALFQGGRPRLPDLHVRAEERHELRQRHAQTLPLRLEEVAHLVDEDQEDEPEPELPAVEERRVDRERDEEGEELPEHERPLECGRTEHDRRAGEPLE